MTYKLISDHPNIHDFAHKMRWGHNIEEIGKSVPYEYSEIITQESNWYVFHYAPILRGDVIIRNMESGKIGAFEIIESEKDSCGSPFGPNDLYYVLARFCGYYDKERNVLDLFKGYGIEKNIFS